MKKVKGREERRGRERERQLLFCSLPCKSVGVRLVSERNRCLCVPAVPELDGWFPYSDLSSVSSPPICQISGRHLFSAEKHRGGLNWAGEGSGGDVEKEEGETALHLHLPLLLLLTHGLFPESLRFRYPLAFSMSLCDWFRSFFFPLLFLIGLTRKNSSLQLFIPSKDWTFSTGWNLVWGSNNDSACV